MKGSIKHLPFINGKPTIEGCPCCVSGSDEDNIHSKQLRQLNGDDLSRYAFKAMTTWGDIEDFKYYLPGIFELLATENLIADAFVVLDKLEYGQWKNWLGNEKDSIVAFLFAWWEDLIKNKSSFDNEAFIAVCKLTEDRDKLLDSWTISFDDYSFNNFVELVHDYYSDLSGKKKEFKELDHKSIEKLIDWIKRSSVMLERGFFHFESKDQKYAEKVSETLYIFERMG